MNRQEFLQFHWLPFPEAPFDLLYSGRILLIKDNFITLEKNQMATDFRVEDSKWLQILQPGDLIAVDSRNKITLLVPGQPLSNIIPIARLQLWSKFIETIRQYFKQEEFNEISTPTLVPCPGTEPTLEAMSTEVKNGSSSKKVFLPTSPELHLKKALCLGFENIFELKNCFRNGEFSPHHQPEFTMLEWYRSYRNLSSIQYDARNLIQFLISKLPEIGVFVPAKEETVTVAELFKKYAGVIIQPDSNLDDYKKMAADINLKTRGLESIDDYFFAIFLEKIEPKLNPKHLVFVKDYPPFQAALARLTPDGWADRMEVYFAGFELANAFNELNDPDEQERRFNQDLQKRKTTGRAEIDLDYEFIDYLRKGMPPAAGIALGVERLFMALYQINDIRDLKLFPYR